MIAALTWTVVVILAAQIIGVIGGLISLQLDNEIGG